MQHATNTKNSNVASEGDQTLCNYKGVFLKSYRQIAVVFLPILWSFSEFIARIAKLRIFSYIIRASYVFKHFFAKIHLQR